MLPTADELLVAYKKVYDDDEKGDDNNDKDKDGNKKNKDGKDAMQGASKNKNKNTKKFISSKVKKITKNG